MFDSLWISNNFKDSLEICECQGSLVGMVRTLLCLQLKSSSDKENKQNIHARWLSGFFDSEDNLRAG